MATQMAGIFRVGAKRRDRIKIMIDVYNARLRRFPVALVTERFLRMHSQLQLDRAQDRQHCYWLSIAFSPVKVTFDLRPRLIHQLRCHVRSGECSSFVADLISKALRHGGKALETAAHRANKLRKLNSEMKAWRT